MCNKKSDTLAWAPRSRSRSATSSATITSRTTATTPSSSSNLKPSSSSTSSAISLTSIQHSLNERSILYSLLEIRAATNNFLLKRFSSSSWRCRLRDKDVLVFQREFRGGGDAATVQDRLSSISRSHHKSLVGLIGASLLTSGDSIFLVYEFVPGASLADCLRNPRNPSYSALPTWTSRMQVATDVAQGLEYIHRHSSTRRKPGHAVHNRIKSSSVIVLDHPKIHAKICHFGTAELSGEIDEEDDEEDEEQRHSNGEIERAETKKAKRTRRRRKKIEGTRGYMAPEVIAGRSVPMQKTDVFAFGVVVLELLSGEEPIRYRYDRNRLESVSLIDTARDVLGSEEGEWDEKERQRRLRRWVDGRLKDSFPVDVGEKVLTLALECVEEEAVNRPGMEKVAGKLSQLLMKSTEWESKHKIPTAFSVSMAPR